MAKHSHTAPPASAAATGRLRRAIVLSLICIYALLRLPPWSPRVVGASLDDSWRWAFHEVWRLGLQHGTEFVFSSGPWGFVITETYHPATFGLMLVVYSAASLVLALSLWAILRPEIRRPRVDIHDIDLAVHHGRLYGMHYNTGLPGTPAMLSEIDLDTGASPVVSRSRARRLP